MNQNQPQNLSSTRSYPLLFVVSFWALGIAALYYPFTVSELEKSELVLEPLPPEPVPDFASMNIVEEKKIAFFSYLAPEIERQNGLILKEREFIKQLKSKLQSGQKLKRKERKEFDRLTKKYAVKIKTSDIDILDKLINRVDVIPVELALMQAANESAWGTSRFARKGYNFFGLWCFKKGCGFVPSRRDAGTKHEVAKFRNLSHAVMTYLRNLNRHYAYAELRAIRRTLREQGEPVTAEALAQGLKRYSERGQDYIDELLAMIEYNKKYL